MSDEWYYAEDGETLGPLAASEVFERLSKTEGPHLVWSPGMPAWTDARALPQFSRQERKSGDARARTAAVSSFAAAAGRKGLAARARHELISYLAVSGYLMVWFIAVMFYKATILRSLGVDFAPIGIAVAKALILGKFIITLEMVKLGERRQNEILAVQIVKKALLFTLALIVMTLIEELVMGHFHGRTARETLAEMGGGSLAQTGAMAVLMFLVLLPYLAFRRLALEFGNLPEMLFVRRPPKTGA